jgi:predicted NBD/HSP70 family sugar kinase
MLLDHAWSDPGRHAASFVEVVVQTPIGGAAVVDRESGVGGCGWMFDGEDKVATGRDGVVGRREEATEVDDVVEGK